MAKVNWHWKMSVEEAIRLASSGSLYVNENDLYILLVEARNEGWSKGWEEGWDARDDETTRVNDLV